MASTTATETRSTDLGETSATWGGDIQSRKEQVALALFIIVPMQANDYLSDTLWERGKAVAREIERKLDIDNRVLSGSRDLDEKASSQIDVIVRGEEEIAGVWVLVCSDSECTEELEVRVESLDELDGYLCDCGHGFVLLQVAELREAEPGRVVSLPERRRSPARRAA